jgi:hypothetical protein
MLADAMYICLPYNVFTTFNEPVLLIDSIATVTQLLSNISKLDADIAVPVCELNNTTLASLSLSVSLTKDKLNLSPIEPLETESKL